MIDWSLIHAVSSDLSLINLIRLFPWYSFITRQPFITNVVNLQGKCAKKTLSRQEVCQRKNMKLLFHFENSQTSEEEKVKTMCYYVWLWYMIRFAHLLVERHIDEIIPLNNIFVKTPFIFLRKRLGQKVQSSPPNQISSKINLGNDMVVSSFKNIATSRSIFFHLM